MLEDGWVIDENVNLAPYAIVVVHRLPMPVSTTENARKCMSRDSSTCRPDDQSEHIDVVDDQLRGRRHIGIHHVMYY